MTDTSTTTTATTRIAAAAPVLPDVRPALDRAVALATATVAAVEPDQLDAPTPCTGFDVRGLARHLLAAIRRITVVGRGEHFSTVAHQIVVPDDELATSFRSAANEMRTAWANDSLLDWPFTLPFGTAPGRVALGIYLGEVSTHTWDLAAATGQQPAFDSRDVEIALGVVQIGLPAEGREGIPFGPVHPVALDASAIDRLVAWEGRNPAWSIAAT